MKRTKRTVVVSTRVTPAEKALIETGATVKAVSVSDYVREWVLKQAGRDVDSIRVGQATAER